LLLKANVKQLPKQFKTMHQFVLRTMQRNYVGRKVPTRVRKTVTRSIQLAIKKRMHLKSNISCRKIAASFKKRGVRISKTSINNCTRRLGLRPFRRYKQQKLKDVHKIKRLKTAKLWVKKFGIKPTTQRYIFSKMINTDFSAYIRCVRSHNSKNDVVYGQTRDEVEKAGLGGLEMRNSAVE